MDSQMNRINTDKTIAIKDQRPKWSRWRRIRQVVQILALLLFLYLLLVNWSAGEAATQSGLFFRLNPLTALTAMLAGRAALPVVLASPSPLVFDPVPADGSAERSLEVRNDGPGEASVDAVSLDAAPGLAVAGGTCGPGTALGAGAGFALALVLMAGVREKLDLANVPELVKGTAAALIVAGILSMGFMGFAGLGR